MGIDVWVARRGTAAAVAVVSEAKSEAMSVAAAPTEVAPAAAPEPVARALEPGTEPAQAGAESLPIAEPPEPAAIAAAPVASSSAAAAAPTDIAAVCLAGDAAVMLVDHCPADQRRLMLDVFAAAAGHKQRAERKELAFSFDGDEQAQGRAFAAFVDKQLADHDPQFVLCSEGLCGHLPQQSNPRPVIVLPPLVELGKRVELKRELWQQIQSHQN